MKGCKRIIWAIMASVAVCLAAENQGKEMKMDVNETVGKSGKNIGFMVPKKMYAVVGREINIYFRNLVNVINPDMLAFEVNTKLGRTDATRWHCIPTEEEVGEHRIGVSVWNDDGKIAEAETTLVVVPANAGEGKELVLLEIGASCMAAAGHGDALWQRFQAPGNPKLTMLGSHAPGYGAVQPGGPANEAYGGWTWTTFFEKTKTNNLANDGLHPARPTDVPSPFLFKKGDEFTFDFAQYLDKVCGGRKPDAVLFELGVNGLFLLKSDEDVKRHIENRIVPYMKRMMEDIRRVVPDVKLGVQLIPTGSVSQDAFGKNYGTNQSRRRWLRNAYLLHACYEENAAELGYELVPAYVNFDCTVNYPQQLVPAYEGSTIQVKTVTNALHPTREGYGQWADSEYFWLKYIMQN
ncbi:MAG: SGNH/GDSL hydrolase family protein, partial [Victivallales bacterium]|nr:SGNH/GDSL hydrolase family protein [Victivallales bacterium]